MNIRQIAKAANVSVSTVSFVLNNRPGVKAETRQRVTQLLLANGYTIKNTQASSEPEPSATGTLLFVRYLGSGSLIESKDDFFVQTLNGIEQKSRDLGYMLSIVNADETSIESTLACAENTACGVVLFGTEFPPEKVSLLQACTVPLIVIDAHFPHTPINTVEVDNELTAFLAVDYLHAIGHTQIGYLHSTERTGSIPERETGYYNAMAYHGLSVNPDHVVRLELFIDRAYQQMVEYLKNAPVLPTAFWADNDILAAAAIRALKECKYRVPEDISVMGTDDSYVGLACSPSLTTLRIPKQQLGEQAVLRIHELIARPDPCNAAVKMKICVSLVTRESVSAPCDRNS